MKSQFVLRALVQGAVLAISVAACSRAPAPEGAESAASPAEPPAVPYTTEVSAEFGESLLWADPLATCESGQTTVLHWSDEAVAQGPASIELGDSEPGVFARVGEAGEKETGPWAYPGAVVVLRGDDGVVRARTVLKAVTDCAITP